METALRIQYELFNNLSRKIVNFQNACQGFEKIAKTCRKITYLSAILAWETSSVLTPYYS